MKILVVEDDPGISRVLKRALTEAGYSVELAADGEEAQDRFELAVYDLVILDLLIPKIEGGGVALCRHIRSRNSDIPLLMVTALDSPRDKVKGLDAGADDYLVKPFSLIELLARVRALSRRLPKADPAVLKVATLELYPATRHATRAGRHITLTAKEFAVLDYLMRNAGRIVSQTELLEHAWDEEYAGLSNVVETYIRYLRKKLTAPGERDVIETRRGSGYIIQVSP